MATIKSNNIKCKSNCTGYKWLCDNCIKNLNNYGNNYRKLCSKLTKDYLLADSIQEMDRIKNITRVILIIKNQID